jgi:translation initiation factor IF-2
MPVRIYDISKKLGLENKVILAKAKAMGIAAAKVPSSSLDKITAEDLENHLLADHPEIAAKFAAPPVVEPPKPPPVEEKVVFITAPPPEPPKPEAIEEPPKVELTPPPAVEEPKPPPEPPKPAGPKVGEKV